MNNLCDVIDLSNIANDRIEKLYPDKYDPTIRCRSYRTVRLRSTRRRNNSNRLSMGLFQYYCYYCILLIILIFDLYYNNNGINHHHHNFYASGFSVTNSNNNNNNNNIITNGDDRIERNLNRAFVTGNKMKVRNEGMNE